MDDSKGNHGHDQEPTHEHLRADAAAGDEEPKQEPVVVVAPPPEYPQRPWEPDCSYYLKFGRCGYGTTCMFNHPPIRPSSAIAGGGGGVEHQQGQETTTEFPQRSGEADCSYYVKFGRCKYGMSCMFNHPPPRKLVVTIYILCRVTCLLFQIFPDKLNMPNPLNFIDRHYIIIHLLS
jgi:hypothetical protein